MVFTFAKNYQTYSYIKNWVWQEGGWGKFFMKLGKGLIIQNRMHLELLEFESLHCYVNTK